MAEEHETSKLVELFPHSIEVTRGAKGQYGWTIKARFKDTLGLTPQVMADTMANIDKEMRERFKDQPQA
jgi:hypothetical protein